MTNRNYTFIDQLCLSADKALRSIFGKTETTGRENPSYSLPHMHLSEKERQHVAGLMRVNHTGEVCAQALYHAQSIISRDRNIKEKMQHAAIEEGDHLAWCNDRLIELSSHTSYLNPVWYAGSFIIGLAAGLVGDSWNLGFLAETENQVVKHLENHLKVLPKEDLKTQKILEQMREDEAEHRDEAVRAGAKELPEIIKKAMAFTSKIMVTVAYKV